ncbi:hypothetical protein RS030_71004 [Cryptosporidium xiaoi]|uniref:EXS domain-containing protein n=1 Tax=Cryptosporidium xiaoi TaxID=659607 RepID=A0AAV9XVD7_9CRYT
MFQYSSDENEFDIDLKKVWLLLFLLIKNIRVCRWRFIFNNYNGDDTVVIFRLFKIVIKIAIYSVSWIMVLIWDAYEYGMVFYGLILSIYIVKYSKHTNLNFYFEDTTEVKHF